MSVLLTLVVAAGAAAPVPPDRLIDCRLGRVTNFAATSPAELGIVGEHRIVVLQPSAAVEVAGTPPKHRSAGPLLKLHDPDKVLPVTRVDYMLDGYPERFELLSELGGGVRGFVSLGKADPATGTATGSAGVIEADGATLRRAGFLQGSCTVTVGPALAATFDKLKAAR